jgi:hypothetical protein
MLDRWLKNARGAEVFGTSQSTTGADPHKYAFFLHLISADRGMISAETMAELEARRLLRLFSACVSAPPTWSASWCSTVLRRSRRW